MNAQLLKRYRDIAMLLIRYGRSDLVERAGLDQVLAEDLPDTSTAAPERLASDLEHLGPTFVKLGQLLSTRPDLLPEPYLVELARLQDAVEPFAADVVARIIEEELGSPIPKVFAHFDVQPRAAASLAQVHCAELRDGRRVAIKIQRPGIRREVALDLEALGSVAELLHRHSDTARRYSVLTIYQTFRKTLLQELDLMREAASLENFREYLQKFPRIVVPAPIHEHTTSKVLTMEFIDGSRIDALSDEERDALPGAELAEELFQAYLHQILVEGTFHADPHPGNVLLTRTQQLGLIDLGMVGYLRPAQQRQLLHLLLALSDTDGDRAAIMVLRLATPHEVTDPERFQREIAELVSVHGSAPLKALSCGRLLMQICRVAATSGVLLPSELSVLAKALLNLDQIALGLDPAFDPAASIRRYVQELMRARIGRESSTGGMFSTLLDAKELMENLPRQAHQILEKLAADQLRMVVQAPQAPGIMESLEKVANRITAGVVLASLIIGAAMMMRVETGWQIFGYPGFSITLFLGAATCGIWLVIDVFRRDRKRRP